MSTQFVNDLRDLSRSVERPVPPWRIGTIEHLACLDLYEQLVLMCWRRCESLVVILVEVEADYAQWEALGVLTDKQDLLPVPVFPFRALNAESATHRLKRHLEDLGLTVECVQRNSLLITLGD